VQLLIREATESRKEAPVWKGTRDLPGGNAGHDIIENSECEKLSAGGGSKRSFDKGKRGMIYEQRGGARTPERVLPDFGGTDAQLREGKDVPSTPGKN